MTAPAIGGEGVVAYPIPAEARTAFVSADDAAALAVAAIGRADLDGATFDLAGPEVLTGNDVAASFAAALGRAVRYQAIPLDRFEAGLRPAVGEAAAREIVAMYRWDAERSDGGRNEVDSVPSLAALPTRLTSFAEWIGGRAEFAAPTRPEPEPVLR